MTSDPKLQELLAPLTEPEPDVGSRRYQVDREKIVSRMVEVSLEAEDRFSGRARLFGALALAASFALATWGGVTLLRRNDAASAAGIEVVAVRGSVTGVQGSKSSGLHAGQTAVLSPEGTLETSQNAEARLKTKSGFEIELHENTRVSLNELGAASASSAVRLDRGRVRCVIPHQPGRTFAVVTSAARVIDVGTTFSVSIEPAEGGTKTVVHVEEGEVLVQHAGGQSRLTASESWTSGTEPPKVVAEAPPSEPEAVEEAPPVVRRDAAKRRPETLAAETKLLRSGLASEQKGDLRAAAAAFESLVTRYPGSQLAPDAKAALSRVKGRLESSK
jgi:hypothetical protein